MNTTDKRLPACPECDGPWLDSFRFQHDPACKLGQAQDQTQAADYARGLGRFTRTSTPTELALLAGAFGTRLQTVVTNANTGVPRLTVAGYDPNTDRNPS